MKGIDGGYKLSELLFGRGGSADAIVNVAAVELRFWAVVLAKKLVFDKTYKKIGVAGSHFSTHGHDIFEGCILNVWKYLYNEAIQVRNDDYIALFSLELGGGGEHDK